MKTNTLSFRDKGLYKLLRACFLIGALIISGMTSETSAQCNADAGSLMGFKPTDCLQAGGTVIGGVPVGDAVVPAGYQVIYVLTEGAGLLIQDASANPTFTVTAIGDYTVHTLVYDPNTLNLGSVVFGVTTGFDVNSLLIQGGGSICASLDVSGTSISVDNPDAGTISADAAQYCLSGGSATISASPGGNAYVPAGYSTVYVLTEGPGLVIQGAGATPSFVVNGAGDYTIHTLVYDPVTLDLGIVVPGTTTGFDVNGLLLQGGGTICASLDVAGAPVSVVDCGTPCIADAGSLMGYKPTDCLQTGGTVIGGIPMGNAVVPAGYQTIYVLTEGPGLVIQQASAYPVFTVTAIGDYTVHTLVYDPNTLNLGSVVFGVTTGFDVNSLLIQGGGSICASLDVTGTSISVDNPDAGTITADSAQYCLSGGAATLSATPDGNAYVPSGYSTVYVLTEGPGLVIQGAGASPSFVVNGAGDYIIHTLVYDPNTLSLGIVVPGTTTGFDVNGLLIQGGGGICASLDVAGAPISVIDCGTPCDADAGTITADQSSVCLDNGSAVLSATPDGNDLVPAGYQTVYVLTQGAGLVIQQAGTTPSFTVSDTGSYIIHTLVYDPNTLDLNIVVPGVTTGFDVNGLLIQGGGSICASLDVAGAPISVIDCGTPCDADAGTITADQSSVCLDNGSAVLSATPDGNDLVPAGYQTVYVLTQGAGLVIQQAGTTPSFTVSDTGSYIIHTLVYDPNTLDLNIVVPGVTTGFDVNGLLIQGGGSICASLDVAGAPILVDPCPVPCLADAGTLTADSATYCLDNSGIFISATPDGNSVVPAGYQTLYVLTEGAGLTILQANPTPVFSISDTGNYTIHTLVYDPNTLNLSLVVFGTTVAVDVLGLLVQGGGLICASLDVPGAPITVVDCGELCTADAGSITADLSLACIDSTSVIISATPDGNDIVPAGYQTVYVLTQGSGLVIQQAGATPSFTVSDTGSYIIHTLVYDPNTLDLNSVVPWVTTGFDVNGLLIQGGGAICASLDVAGAPILVELCSASCLANAGTIGSDSTQYCLINSTVDVSATPDGNDVVPAGYQTVYVLTQGAGLVIQQAGAAPTFTVSDTGNYIIHTLVYDPATLDLNIVVPGVTTGFDVNGLLIQGGGSICASLDVTGAPFNVALCSQTCIADAGTLTPDQSAYCLVNATVDISATPDGNIVVPAGYQVGYVLTEGPNLIVMQAGVTPNFAVADTGSYTIHTLVYDPNTLNLSLIVPGTTAAIDVLGLLIQGGGTICASLDVAGAPIIVETCIVTGNLGTGQGYMSDELSVWPNPATDNVTIEVKDLPVGEYQVKIIDFKGVEMLRPIGITLDDTNGTYLFDISDLRNGAYTLMVISDVHLSTGKIIKTD